MKTLLFILISYVFSSIPWGYIIAKNKGVDITKVGSGNIGGTNIYRTFGLRLGILVGILDLLKGFLSVTLAQAFFRSDFVVGLSIISSISGHIFPVFLKFKGGKGAATTGGILLAILPIYQFLILLVVWILLLKIIKIMSLTNLILVTLLPVYFFFQKKDITIIFATFVIAILIYYAHRKNLSRLTKGTELKLKI